MIAMLTILASITLGTSMLNEWIKSVPYGNYAGQVSVIESTTRNFNQQIRIILQDGYVAVAAIPKYPRITSGDKLEVSGILREINPLDVYESNYRSDGIHAVLENVKFNHVSVNKHDYIDFCHRLTFVATYEFGNFLCGVTIGKYNLAKSTERVFKDLGLTHVLSVSGYNITVIVGMLAKLAGRFNRKHLLVFSIPCLAIYLWIVGVENIPATRAVLMGCVLVIAQLSGRPGSVWLSLLYANTILFLSNPYLFQSVSWQLSMSSLVGILILSDRLNKKLRIVPSWFRQEFAVSIAASISTAPVLLTAFGGVSLISPVANLIVAPLVPLFMMLGTICLIIGIAFPVISTTLLQSLEPIWDVFIRILTIINQEKMLTMLIFVAICILYYLYSTKNAPKH